MSVVVTGFHSGLGGLWVDFYEGGHREVDEQELDEFET